MSFSVYGQALKNETTSTYSIRFTDPDSTAAPATYKRVFTVPQIGYYCVHPGFSHVTGDLSCKEAIERFTPVDRVAELESKVKELEAKIDLLIQLIKKE